MKFDCVVIVHSFAIYNFVTTASLLVDRLREPIETFVQTVAADRVRALNEPRAILEGEQLERARDFGDRHRRRHVLLVRKDEQRHAGQLRLAQHLPQLVAGFASALAVVRVDDVDDGVGVVVIVLPERANLRTKSIDVRE